MFMEFVYDYNSALADAINFLKPLLPLVLTVSFALALFIELFRYIRGNPPDKSGDK